jgi:hypothetical protein
VATGIAVVKAVLVILYFMHVKDGTRLTWVFSGAAFVWLAIMFGLTLNDYVTRDWQPPGMKIGVVVREPAEEHRSAEAGEGVSPSGIKIAQ